MLKSLRRKLILAIMQTEIYRWLLLHVIPYIRFSCYYTSLRGKKYHAGYKHLRPGDVILTLDRKKLTTFLIPGDFSHAAFCVAKGSDEEYEIAEMTHTNYTKSFFFDLCKEADRVVIGRGDNEFWTSAYIEEMIQQCKSFENAKYDIQFALGVKELACSELIYEADFQRYLQCNLEDVAGIGSPYISPTGIYKALLRYGQIIWDSDDEIN